MKAHPPNSRQDCEERARVAQERALNMERSNGDKPRRSWVRLAIAGIILALLIYLVHGCFVDLGLYGPKSDRVNLQGGGSKPA